MTRPGRLRRWWPAALAVLAGSCRGEDAAPASAAVPRTSPADDPPSCLERANGLSRPDEPVTRALCSEMRAHDVPGASVVVAVDGAIVMRFANGVRCLGARDPVVVDTAFR